MTSTLDMFKLMHEMNTAVDGLVKSILFLLHGDHHNEIT